MTWIIFEHYIILSSGHLTDRLWCKNDLCVVPNTGFSGCLILFLIRFKICWTFYQFLKSKHTENSLNCVYMHDMYIDKLSLMSNKKSFMVMVVFVAATLYSYFVTWYSYLQAYREHCCEGARRNVVCYLPWAYICVSITQVRCYHSCLSSHHITETYCSLYVRPNDAAYSFQHASFFCIADFATKRYQVPYAKTFFELLKKFPLNPAIYLLILL